LLSLDAVAIAAADGHKRVLVNDGIADVQHPSAR